MFGLLALIFCAMACSAAAAETGMEYRSSFVLEGIHLEELKVVNGVTLVRNGEGVRQFSLFGMNLRIYVAGFWTASQMQSIEEVLACRQPKQMDFTFLRSVDQSRVTGAWQHQLEQSVTYKYDGYDADRDAFINAFGPIENGGTQSVLLLGNETHVIDQGVLKMKINGDQFQTAFLSMWFGEQAVTPELKSGLLGMNRLKAVVL
ncbi:Chalcone isomerase-like protein [Fragilaria crotonensis]|nr:Chalcone isomerase-like protein [Fragilaria crotonensis]